jgi:hypothetical protein
MTAAVPATGWPDAETTVMALLAPIARTVTSTPTTLTPPLIRVQRVGGSDDGLTDFPRVEVACYGNDRPEAWRLAEQVRQAVLASIRTVINTSAGEVLVDNARTDNPPIQVPYATSEDVRRVLAYYRFAWRRSR